MKWFKSLFKKPSTPGSSREELLALELEKAKLPENLNKARLQFKETILNNGDLQLEPYALEKDNKTCGFGYKVFYKKKELGSVDLESDSDTIVSFVLQAQLFCPELFPVKSGEYFNINDNQIVKVVEVFIDDKINQMTYILECVCNKSRQQMSHYYMVLSAKKIMKVG